MAVGVECTAEYLLLIWRTKDGMDLLFIWINYL